MRARLDHPENFQMRARTVRLRGHGDGWPFEREPFRGAAQIVWQIFNKAASPKGSTRTPLPATSTTAAFVS